MSHAVDPNDLSAVAEPYGTTPFLLYSSADGSARVNHVLARIEHGEPVVIVRGFGRGVHRLVEDGAMLSLLWPAPDGIEFSLIADGVGALGDGPDGESDPILSINISAAVLHRPAPVDGNARC